MFVQTFREDIDAHREIMQNLDRTGTYLKYFGRKQDTVYIKNLLISIKLRWKKLVRRAEEKGRLLQQAHKEDKRVSSRHLSVSIQVLTYTRALLTNIELSCCVRAHLINCSAINLYKCTFE